MGFLKKNKVPTELPDLAISRTQAPTNPLKQPSPATPEPQLPAPKPVSAAPIPPVQPAPPVTAAEPKQLPKPVFYGGGEKHLLEEPKPAPTKPSVEMHHKEIAGEDYLEFSSVPNPNAHANERHEHIRKQFSEVVKEEDPESFFDKVLEDINGEIADLGKLEQWYKEKFLPQDVVSNMRDYWEGNKADMIIKSFGSEYKEKIQEKIKMLQELEADWREIYFKLVKKEEEMKKEERVLKETLSEFVELCKRRNTNNGKKTKA